MLATLHKCGPANSGRSRLSAGSGRLSNFSAQIHTKGELYYDDKNIAMARIVLLAAGAVAGMVSPAGGAIGKELYQVHTDGSNSITTLIFSMLAASEGQIHGSHEEGSAWWVWSFTAGENALYILTDNGLSQYTGTSSLLPIDDNTTIESIAAGSVLYQQRKDRSIWQYTGTSCGGGVCPGWLEIDDSATSGPPVAGPNTVYQIRRPTGKASIWQYNGTPCNGSVCSGWAKLDDNPATKSIVAGPATF
jgi:hypothetical protein